MGVKIEFKKIVEAKDVDIVATGSLMPPRGIGYGISFKTDSPDCLYAIMDNKLIPYGYAYLIVVNGRGTLAIALTRNFPIIKEYLSKTIERFRSFSQFKIEEPKEFSGFASAAIITKKEKIYVGEAGGFQDMFWGFGMRYAFLSGYLASQAIIEQQDYWQMVRKTIHPSMKVSAVNRLLLHIIGNTGLSYLIEKVGASFNQLEILRRQYRFCWYKKILYPLANIILKIYEPR